MDDIDLMSESVSGVQTLLSRCSTALKWAGMDFRCDKCRSIVIIKGKTVITDEDSFQPSIPSIHAMPIKFLGRIIDGSISDKNSIDEIETKLLEGLSIIDKSFFSGTQKLWILQHLLIPRIQWPLMIYDVCISFAHRLEQKVSTYIRKWLRLHRSTTNLCLYSSTSPCPIPVKSLTSIFKSSKISGHLLLRDSRDPLVSSSVPTLKAGSWDIKKTIKVAEDDLAFQKILGHIQHGTSGLGLNKLAKMPPKQSHEYRRLVSKAAKEIEEENSFARAVQLQVQGQWTRWTNYVQNDLSWKTILAMPQSLLSFCLGATFDTLPSPSNLQRWHITTEPSCFLCGKEICTAAHILGACKVALSQGRFTFRHDSVLTDLTDTLNAFIANLTARPPKLNNGIQFVKAGEKVPTRRPKSTGILHLASDWVLIADLKEHYVFPPHITITTLRPDIVIYSNSLKRIIIIELTCPCEENMETWHSVKLGKYTPLSTIISSNGWSVDLFAVEVGARGYCAKSLPITLKKLGFGSKLVKSSTKTLGSTSMKSSFCIWLARNSKEWTSKEFKTTSFTPVKNTKSPKSSTQPAPASRSLLCSQPKQNVNPTQQAMLPKQNTLKLPQRNVGFINLGNTCYANSMLQALSILPELWNQFLKLVVLHLF